MITIDITEFLHTECMRDYSASVAELGQGAAAFTWRANLEAVATWAPLRPDQFDEFRAWVRSSGGWTDEEITAWSAEELQALCHQWIAGDARECGLALPADLDRADWAQIEAEQAAGLIPSSIYRGDDGRIYWECAD